MKANQIVLLHKLYFKLDLKQHRAPTGTILVALNHITKQFRHRVVTFGFYLSVCLEITDSCLNARIREWKM